MTFWSAYFDESTGNDSPILVVAGLLASDAHWSLFEGEWKAVLAEFGITAFHAQHYSKHKKEFRGWDEARRQRLLGSLLDIIKRRAQLGFAAVVHLKEFYEVFQGADRQEVGSPYRLCCTSCFLSVGEWAKENYQIEPVAYFFDAGNAHAGEVLNGFQETRIDPANIEMRLGTVTFGDDALVVPLQAADLAAYEIWKWLDEHFAEKSRHGRFPLQEIIKIPWSIREFDRGILGEMLTRRRGGKVEKRNVRHIIRALRPGQTDSGVKE